MTPAEIEEQINLLQARINACESIKKEYDDRIKSAKAEIKRLDAELNKLKK